MDDVTLRTIRKDIRQELAKTKDANHDFDHACRVWGNAKIIADKLEMSIDLKLLETACWLHDLTWTKEEFKIKHYFNESRLSKKAAGEFLRSYKIDSEEKEVILNAISNHPLGFPWRLLNPQEDVYSKILQDADVLDSFSNERIRKIKQGANKKLWWLIDILIKISKTNIKYFLNYPNLVNKWFTASCEI